MAPDGPDEAGLLRVVPEGRAHLVDHGRERRLRDERARPQPVPDARPGDHPGRLGDEEIQEVEGLRPQVKLLVSPDELAGVAVEDELTEVDAHRTPPGG